MNKIIALRGKSKSGKSTTIAYLHELLLANRVAPLPGNYQEYGADFSDIFIDGITGIGITNAGNTCDTLHSRLKHLMDDGCQICICTCGASGDTQRTLQEFTGFQVDFVPKTYAQDFLEEESVNKEDARKLYTLLKEHLYTI
jgi:hypothetical protein